MELNFQSTLGAMPCFQRRSKGELFCISFRISFYLVRNCACIIALTGTGFEIKKAGTTVTAKFINGHGDYEYRCLSHSCDQQSHQPDGREIASPITGNRQQPIITSGYLAYQTPTLARLD